MDSNQSRRAFLRRSATLGIAGGAAPFVTQLAAIGASEPTSLADGGMSAGGAIEVARGRGARDDIRLGAVTGRGRQVGY